MIVGFVQLLRWLGTHSPTDLSLVLMYRLALWLSGSVALLALSALSALWLGSGSTSVHFVGGGRPAALVLRSAFCALRSAFVGIFLICLTAGARHVSLGRSARMHDRFCDTAAAPL